MKTLLAFLFISTQVLAVSNPLIRNCQMSGGQFLVFQTEGNDVPTCHVGQSFIGAMDLMNHINQDQPSQSIIDYTSSIYFCQAQQIQLKTTEGFAVDFCFYDDGSVIDMNSLYKGRYSADQKALNHALGL